MAAKRKLKTRSYKEKYDIIRFCDANPGRKKSDIASKFGIPAPTLFDILKNRQKVLDTIERVDSRRGTVKRVKHVSFEDVDSALIKWFRQISAKTRINNSMLLLEARRFAVDLGYEEAVAETIGAAWIGRFKTRYDIGRVFKARESATVDSAIIDEWKHGKLNDITMRYKPCDIYNADETGLFYSMLPEHTLSFKDQLYHTGTIDSEFRITVLAAANMDGSEKLPLYVIGKDENPSAFKNVRSLPVSYSSNKKASMNSQLFDMWMRNLDRRMVDEDRRICMVIDNCPAHLVYKYENIEIVFLPDGTDKDRTNPMDAGIISNLKFQYRLNLATQRLNAIEKETPFDWDILDALFAIKDAWSHVQRTTIAECFRQVDFVADNILQDTNGTEELDNDVTAINIEDSGRFRHIWNGLMDFFGEAALPSLEEYLDIDRNEEGTDQYNMTDVKIVQESVKMDHGDVASDEEFASGDALDSNVESTLPPTIDDAFRALDTLRCFTLSVDQCPSDIIDLGDKYETFLTNEMIRRHRRSPPGNKKP